MVFAFEPFTVYILTLHSVVTDGIRLMIKGRVKKSGNQF